MPAVRVVALALVLMALAASAHALAASTTNRPYAALVRRVGSALDLSPRLIHAVIAAESNYDRIARSPAGALGLMQLMPVSGAWEAYRWLYGRDRIPTDESLLRPAVSIWLGTAYLRILADRYFAWIDDPKLRLRAVIAAYIWGPTRVLARLFPERRQLSVARFMVRFQEVAPREVRRYMRRVLEGVRELRGDSDAFAGAPRARLIAGG